MSGETAVREWRTLDKSDWGDGPWQLEPDKIQWLDPETGLDCLMVRTEMGHWCGYVGVAESHPLFHVSYNEASPALQEAWERRKQEPLGEAPSFALLLEAVFGSDDPDRLTPDRVLNVHGGITFSDFCHEATPELWQRLRERMPESAEEARRYPYGDAARFVRKMTPVLDDFEAFRAYGEASFVCHTPFPGRPSRVWWLGFDCAHAGDLSPAMQAMMRPYAPRFPREEVYRDRAYVEGEVRKLARQLDALSGATRASTADATA